MVLRVVVVTALLGSALIAASVASIMYGSLVQGLHLGAIRTYPAAGSNLVWAMSSQAVAFTIFVNVFGFFAVALLTSYLSENLRQTGRRLEEASDYLRLFRYLLQKYDLR